MSRVLDWCIRLFALAIIVGLVWALGHGAIWCVRCPLRIVP